MLKKCGFPAQYRYIASTISHEKLKGLQYTTLSDANKEARPMGMKIIPTAIKVVMTWNQQLFRERQKGVLIREEKGQFALESEVKKKKIALAFYN